MTELEWDSGWLPSSGNIQVRFQTVADGGAFVDMEGVANLNSILHLLNQKILLCRLSRNKIFMNNMEKEIPMKRWDLSDYPTNCVLSSPFNFPFHLFLGLPLLM